MNNWYFTSDLHLSHTSMLKGYRGTIFSSMEEHNETIMNNLLSIPKGSNLVIAGDLFWKFSSKDVEQFFTKFKKAGISIFIVYGNHDKMSWFKYSVIRSQGHLKEMSIEGQSITISHYRMSVWNKSHYNAFLLHGHQHVEDYTDRKVKQLPPTDTFLTGKKMNINIELWNFRPVSWEQVKEYMSKCSDNFDLIKKTTN